MRDGHKEAAKELMSIFRLVVGADLALFVLFANLHIRGFLSLTNPWTFHVGLGMAIGSTVLCCWLFFVVVRMFHEEVEAIAYELPVLVIGGIALILFILSVGMILLGQV